MYNIFSFKIYFYSIKKISYTLIACIFLIVIYVKCLKCFRPILNFFLFLTCDEENNCVICVKHVNNVSLRDNKMNEII